MVKSDFQILQSRAISYVDGCKGGILNAATSINGKLSAQDLDDLVSEGYIIALEILASGDFARLEDLFWPKFKRNVWDSYDYLIDFEYLGSKESDESDSHPAKPQSQDLCTFTEECLDTYETNLQFEAVTGSALDILTPSEQKVLCLVLGLASDGCHSVAETSRILGMSRFATRTLFDRILVKVKDAIRRKSPQGWITFSRRKPRVVH